MTWPACRASHPLFLSTLAKAISVAVRGTVLSALALVLGAPVLAADRPPVGAIRWDAWHGDRSVVGLAVERTLSPPQWRYRLPFFGEEVAPDRVRIRADRQEVMDEEIRLAWEAGLDYWAFVTYPPGSEMSIGLDLYLASRLRRCIRFCLILQGGWIAGGGLAAWPQQMQRYVQLMREPTYQQVDDGRPLLYLFDPDGLVGNGRWADAAEARHAFDDLRAAARRAGLRDPYLVVMCWTAEQGKAWKDRLGGDALGSYASNGSGRHAPYAELVAGTERYWDALHATGSPVALLVTTGWDRRPRLHVPVPWEEPKGDLEQYYERALPAEIAAHLDRALRWRGADGRPAPAILIYAWNEIDEGGWLVPTRGDGNARLEEIRKVLQPRRLRLRPGSRQ